MISLSRAVAIQSEMESLLDEREYEVASLDVLTLANMSDCTAYDCEFVALARHLGVALVTTDRRLARSFPDTAVLLTDRAP